MQLLKLLCGKLRQEVVRRENTGCVISQKFENYGENINYTIMELMLAIESYLHIEDRQYKVQNR